MSTTTTTKITTTKHGVHADANVVEQIHKEDDKSRAEAHKVNDKLVTDVHKADDKLLKTEQKAAEKHEKEVGKAVVRIFEFVWQKD
jgi:hypothetical protein